MAIVFRFAKFSASGLVSAGAFNVFQTSSIQHFTIKYVAIGFFGAGAVNLDVHIFPTTGGPLNTNKISGTFPISGIQNFFISQHFLENAVIPPSHFVQFRYVPLGFRVPGSVINVWMSGVLTTDQP